MGNKTIKISYLISNMKPKKKMRISIFSLKKALFFAFLFCAIGVKSIAQTATASTRSSFRARTNTQYTAHSELFAEFRPLLQNVPARFTAHLTQISESFKPYTDAEVTLSLMIDGKQAWQQTQIKPVAEGIYRFPVKSEIAGTGTVTISLKMLTYSEQFIIENVTIYADEATALSKQSKAPEEKPVDEITYYKEKSWLETFATAPVGKVKKNIVVPRSAIQTEKGATYVFVQCDPEHFRKQPVKLGKSLSGNTLTVIGLKLGDRIVTLGADKIK